MAAPLLWLFLGLVLLVGGAELLVRGASRLARTAGIAPLVVGLTVVALGTSAPEIAVSVGSAWAGQGDLAMGNVVGSNVFNVLFILGVSATITPLAVAQPVVRLDIPILIAVSFLVLLFGLDGSLSRPEGIGLLAGVVAYTVFLLRSSGGEQEAVAAQYVQQFGADGTANARAIAARLALIAIGLALLVLGARWLVDGAVAMARAIGVSELVIGLTVVAAGTSMPEVATSVLAALRGERDIAVGNVVGSSIFNLLAVLGLTAVVAGVVPVAPSILRFDLPVAIATAVACLPVCFTGHRINRWEGLLFLAYYVAYTAFLILAATEHDALPVFSGVMLWGVIPLTVLTLGVVAWRQIGARRVQRASASRAAG